jgi:hypothetical protein
MADLVYQPPGIYIDESPQPVPNLPSVVALPPARIAIVGPSRGYQENTETIQLGATGVALSRRGINDATVVVKALDGTLYSEATDYNVTQTGTPATEEVTTITRESGGAITLDSVVYVSYRFTDSAYYEAYQSGDWDAIQSRFGPAIDPTTGAVGSALSLAARIAMEQGASDLVLVPAAGATPSSVTAAQLKAALDKLLARDDVGVVVSLPVGISGTDVAPGDTSTAATDLESHVVAATNSGLYRTGVIGYDTAADRNHATVAQTIDSNRVMLAYPNALNWYNGLTNTTMEIGGAYLAAAYAGMMAALPVQIPLTRKQVRGFSAIPARLRGLMTMPFKNELSAAGVTVTEQTADGRLVVRHSVTTDPSSVINRESSIIRAKDAKLRLIYLTVDRSGIIGTAADEETPVRLRSLIEGALNQCEQAGIIVSWSNLSVRRSTTDLTRMEVKYAYEPAYPLNSITVSFSISTTTGELADAAIV